MSSQDIKVGDKVRFIAKSGLGFTEGAIYTVTEVRPTSHNQLRMNNDHGEPSGWRIELFEKVEEPIFQEISDRIQKLIDESQEAINASQVTINKLNECRNLLTS